MRDRLHPHGLFRSMRDLASWRWLVLGILLGTMLAALLTSCNGYVWDIFPEMHYQASYRLQEPPRRMPPTDSVPITGKAREYRFAEAAEIANPLTSTPVGIEAGNQLFPPDQLQTLSRCGRPRRRSGGRLLRSAAATDAGRARDRSQ